MAFTTQGEVRGLRYLTVGSPIPIRFLLGKHRLVEGYHHPSPTFGVSSFGLASRQRLLTEIEALGLKTGRLRALGLTDWAGKSGWNKKRLPGGSFHSRRKA